LKSENWILFTSFWLRSLTVSSASPNSPFEGIPPINRHCGRGERNSRWCGEDGCFEKISLIIIIKLKEKRDQQCPEIL
jgi:hypothetical protein